MNNKIKVLIVEDEPMIARGIETMISQYSNGFKVIGICRNGLEGLEKIKAAFPNLVFTDIRMPVMDGLDMIKGANQLEQVPHFIILTGYEEFTYAQSALHLGVKNYLLKPLEFDSLLNTLNDFKKSYYAEIRQHQNKCIRDLIYNGNFISNSSVLDGYYITFLFIYYGFVIDNTYDELNISRELVKNLDLSFIADIEKQQNIWIYCNKGRHYNECIFTIVSCSDLKCTLSPIITAFQSHIETTESYRNIVVSKTTNNISTLSTIMNECCVYALSTIPFGVSKTMIDKNQVNTDPIFVSLEVQQLCQQIPSKATKEIVESFCIKTIDWWRTKQIAQFQLHNDLRYILSQMLQKSSTLLTSYLSATEMISISDNFDALYDNLLHSLYLIFNLSDQTQKKDSLAIVQRVKKYLDQNYTQPITYKDFYELFGYNEKYISLLFKTEYNISPSKYVSKLRIELSKQLLMEHPQMTLKEVAELSGFADSFYFSRVFKVSEGVSPSNFQKNYFQNY
ncbi:helix-turn-helix protein [Lachnotalea glycerini]|uniref:Stage 0 sporulation protein A homolog n=1 Tax=Lachnotalea glycerini TaxID=1763509 RepID=A0A318EMT1_9FIRM|nr:response regulator [Lachnotalea glycerini]PXV89167.1 helix-turn-helix protein [Lachnotalea glycerini]